MLTSSSRLRYHYENILRQDLLLKLNYNNIMEVPQLCKISISSQVPQSSVKNVSLALEIICGQKVVSQNLQRNKSLIRHRPQNTFQKTSIQKSASLGAKSKKGVILSQQNSHFIAKATLRSTTLMFNFLEKLITLISFYDYTIQFQANTIQITIDTQMPLFPEIQNHFEFFENIQNLNVFIVTNALTEKETQLLWTGLNQKEF